MRKKKKNSFPVKPALLLGAAAVLLLGSTVGSTRAALTIYSENYTAQVSMSNIGVALVENDEIVSQQTYGVNASAEGTLLENMVPVDQKFTPGYPYKEELKVQNTGDIDTFVRVILTRSWQKDTNGDDIPDTKDTELSPLLIDLNLLEDSGWVVAEEEDVDYSDERIVLYYTKALAPEETSAALSDVIRISPEIAQSVKVGDDGKYEYVYNGYTFCLEAEVDAVQTHNAADAIKSAWGVDVTVSDDGSTITLQ